MALYRIDGWDYYPANTFGAGQNDANLKADGWTGGTNNFFVSPGRFGGNAIGLGSNFTSWEPIGKRFTSEQVVVGHAWYMGGLGLMGGQFGFYDAQGATFLNCFMQFEQDGVIRIYRGNGLSGGISGVVVATSKAKAIHPFEWNYIEVKYKQHATAGIFEVRVNKVVVVSYTGPTTHMTLSPILSLATGFDTFSYVGFTGLLFDDRYVLDDTGANNVDYLGNVRVNTQLTTAPGDLTEMLVSGASANWDAVNESALTDAEYAYSSTVGARDLYTMNPNATSQNIFGVQVTGAFRQDDATQMKAHLLVKTHGTLYESAVDQYLAQNYHYYRDMWELNPNTGVGWTAAELNAIQAGQKLLAG